MIKITLAIDSNKTANKFIEGWFFDHFIYPIIRTTQCVWFEVVSEDD